MSVRRSNHDCCPYLPVFDFERTFSPRAYSDAANLDRQKSVL